MNKMRKAISLLLALLMIFSAIPFTAFAASSVNYVDRVEPYIDGDGEYHLGNVAYAEDDGINYAINEDGSIGDELDSVELSYFDFKLINNDNEYQLEYYTGPTADLDKLVIPKTFNGKKITVIGNDINDGGANCRLVPQGTSGFALVLNENITEIKPYTFYAVQITDVTGNTSSLSKIGDYAFSWADSGRGYALDIQLDYPGEILTGSGIFNHMNVTARIKHTTTFSNSSFRQQGDIVYVFTDDTHNYGGPVWTWAEDYNSAAAEFTCKDERCKHSETVNTYNITRKFEDGKLISTATAEFSEKTYTDSVEDNFNSADYRELVMAEVEGGTVTCDTKYAKVGDTVTLHFHPDEGYTLNYYHHKYYDVDGKLVSSMRSYVYDETEDREFEIYDQNNPGGKIVITPEYKKSYRIINTNSDVKLRIARSYSGQNVTMGIPGDTVFVFPEDDVWTGDHEGYDIESIKITDADGNEIQRNGYSYAYFTMPEKDVYVDVTLTEYLYAVNIIGSDNDPGYNRGYLSPKTKSALEAGETYIVGVNAYSTYVITKAYAEDYNGNIVFENLLSSEYFDEEANEISFTMPAKALKLHYEFELSPDYRTVSIDEDSYNTNYPYGYVYVTSGYVSSSRGTLKGNEFTVTSKIKDSNYTLYSLYYMTEDGEKVDLMSDYNGEQTCDFKFIMPDSNITVYYAFRKAEEKHTITFDDSCSVNGSVSSAVNYAFVGETVELTVTPDEHNTLTSLYYEADGNKTDLMDDYDAETGKVSFDMPNADITVYTKFTLDSDYRKLVMAEVEGGTVTCDTKYAKVGDTVTLHFHPDEGYTLNEYYHKYYNVDGEVVSDMSHNVYDETEDREFEIYDQDNPGGKIVITPIYKKSYRIINTNSDVKLRIARYYGGQNVTRGIPGDTVLVFPEDYLYDKDGEGYVIESITVKDAQGNTIDVTTNNGVYFIMPESDVTITATLSDYKYRVTTNNDNGYIRLTNGDKFSEGETFIGQVTPYSHYILSNLYYEDKNGEQVDLMNNGSYNPNTGVVSFLMPASPIKIYAFFELEKFTVTWMVNGTVAEKDENAPYGTTPEYNGETPADYSEEHYIYTFYGWNDGTNTYAADALPAVTGDVTYTAVYTAENVPTWHTVKFQHTYLVDICETSGYEGETAYVDLGGESNFDFYNERCKLDLTEFYYKNSEGETVYLDVTWDYEAKRGAFIMPDKDVTVKVIFRSYNHLTPGTYNHGTVTVDKEKILEGETATITVHPDDGWIPVRVYQQMSYQYTSSAVQDESDRNVWYFTNPYGWFPGDTTIHVDFEADPDWHNITIAETENGTVTYEHNGAYAEDTVTLNVTPEECFTLSSLYYEDANGEKTELMDSYNAETGKVSFDMPAKDITVYATFTLGADYRELVMAEVEGGTVTCDTKYAKIGDTVTLNFHPNDGYVITSFGFVYYDADGNVNTGGARHIYDETGTCEFEIYDRNNSCEIVITPDFVKGYRIINKNEDVKLRFSRTYSGKNVTMGVPNVMVFVFPEDYVWIDDYEGYAIESITVTDADGNEIEVDASDLATFTMPESDVYVDVTLTEYLYAVDIIGSDDSRGYFRTSKTKLAAGETFTAEVAAYSSEYVLSKIYAEDRNGNIVFEDLMSSEYYDEETNTLSFTMPAKALKIHYEFDYSPDYRFVYIDEDSYNTYSGYGRVSSYSKGTLKGTTIYLHSYAENQNYTLSSLYYKTEDGEKVDLMPDYNGEQTCDFKFTMPDSNITVYYAFRKAEDKRNITFDDSCSVNGSVSSAVNYAFVGDTVELTVTPNNGYELGSLNVKDENGVDIAVTDGKFTMPASNVTVSAAFEILKYTVNWIVEGETVETDENVPYGTTPAYDGDTPAKKADEEYGYIFTGWSPEISAVTENVAYTAQFKPITYVAEVEPYIDENGAYILGTVQHYTDESGTNYAVNEDGSVGDKLESIVLSYFDFKLINSGSEYQINYYTGPTEELTELVIPKTFNGKKITVLGNDVNSGGDGCRLLPQGTPGFTLVLNENITEIKPYTFYAVQITAVTGDTSNLNNIGSYAFSWANSGRGHALDIKFDYAGKITTGTEIFNNMNVTAQIKHATTFSKSSFGQQTIAYVVTDDAHTYGEPVWKWEGYNSATATFTCTDDRCKHEETVDAIVTSEDKDGKRIYTATATIDGVTYTDAKEVAIQKVAQDIYNLTVEENIDVNILVDVKGHETDGEVIDRIEYSYPDITTESRNILNETVLADDISTDENGYFAKSFTMAIAQVNEPIKAVIYFTNGTTKEISVSVVSYSKYIIDNASTKGYSEKLVNLCYSVLEYGKQAVNYFGYKYPADITYPEYTLPEMFNAAPEITSQAGLRKGDTVTGIAATQMFILSNAKMRLTFKDDISSLNIESVKVSGRDLTAEIVKTSDNRWAVDISGIYATELSKPVELTLSDGTYVKYAATDWANSVLSYSTNEKSKALAKAMYYYSKAANEFFGG